MISDKSELAEEIKKFKQMNLVSIPMLRQYAEEVKPLDIIDALSRYDVRKVRFWDEKNKARYTRDGD